jgi:hypothetical protein
MLPKVPHDIVNGASNVSDILLTHYESESYIINSDYPGLPEVQEGRRENGCGDTHGR